MSTEQGARSAVLNNPWIASLPLLAGFAVLAVPTFATLGQQVWSEESGAHGPIILATGGWLLWREVETLKTLGKPGALATTAIVLFLALLLYVFGRAFDFISLETVAVYGVGLGMLHALFGLKALMRTWFPLFYLGFLVPPPNWLMDQLTGPLKQFISNAATTPLHALGLPISREGVTIQVGSYQLLVEDACSGMNSLIGLSAISLLYIFLLRGSSLRYSLLLTTFVIPIAVVGNIFRVMILILLTHFYGDEVAQGFLHFAAGMFLFVIDLLLVFLVDSVLVRILPKSWRPA